MAAFGGELIVLDGGFEVFESSLLPLLTLRRLARSKQVSGFWSVAVVVLKFTGALLFSRHCSDSKMRDRT